MASPAGARVFALPQALLHHTRCSVCSPCLLRDTWQPEIQLPHPIQDADTYYCFFFFFPSFTSPGTMKPLLILLFSPELVKACAEAPCITKNEYCATASSRYHRVECHGFAPSAAFWFADAINHELWETKLQKTGE